MNYCLILIYFMILSTPHSTLPQKRRVRVRNTWANILIATGRVERLMKWIMQHFRYEWELRTFPSQRTLNSRIHWTVAATEPHRAPGKRQNVFSLASKPLNIIYSNLPISLRSALVRCVYILYHTVRSLKLHHPQCLATHKYFQKWKLNFLPSFVLVGHPPCLSSLRTHH